MKKALSILLVAALMTASLAGMALANTNDEDTARPYYLSVTGVVTAIDELETGTLVEIALPAADRDARAFLAIDDRTVFVFEEELSIGDTVTAFYLANAPMIMIYPPQYTAAVIVSGTPDSQSVTADRFNLVDGAGNRYLAQGGSLIINIGEDTEVILADGQDFRDGDIDGRRMVVIYDVVTRSLPPMTTPIKVIVLFEDPVTGPLLIDPDMLPGDDEYAPVVTLPAPLPEPPAVAVPLPAPAPGGATLSATGWPIIVNNVQITAPPAYQRGDTVIVPLRAIAEALGYEVEWDATLRSIRLGAAIHVWIGNTEVHVGRMAPQTISMAPTLIDGSTFVPLDFFRVIGVNNAYAFEGQVVIDNINEPME